MSRRVVRPLVADLAEGELFTYASAMAFRTLFASVPIALVAVASLGFFGLTPVWTVDIAPRVHPTVGDPAFAFLDSTVRQILATGQIFWLTAGLLLALWQLSSTIRVTADALNRIYGVQNTRGWGRWLGTSIGVSIAVGLCLLSAAVAVHFGPALAGWLLGPGTGVAIAGRLLGWGIAIAAMLAAIALLLRFAPGERVRWRFVGTGAVMTVAAWGTASAAFGAYLTWVVDYGSLFGGLAIPFVLLLYLNFAALVLLVGVWLERRRHTGVERPLQVAAADTHEEG